MTLSIIKPTRKTLRDAIKALVDANMVGDGLPLVACYAYEKAKLIGETPCMVIVSEPVEPAFEGDVTPSPYTIMAIGAHAFTVYQDIGSGDVDSPEYTEEESENDMDTINQYFLSLMEPYKDRTQEVNPPWDYMTIGKTQYDSYTDLEGNEFRHEYFPMLFQVADVA